MALNDKEVMEFVEKVVKTIQTSYQNKSDCQFDLMNVLEDADLIAEKLTGKRIVKRGHRTVLDELVGNTSLSKIPEKAAIKKATL